MFYDTQYRSESWEAPIPIMNLTRNKQQLLWMDEVGALNIQHATHICDWLENAGSSHK